MPYGLVEYEVYRARKLFLGYLQAVSDVVQVLQSRDIKVYTTTAILQDRGKTAIQASKVITPDNQPHTNHIPF